MRRLILASLALLILAAWAWPRHAGLVNRLVPGTRLTYSLDHRCVAVSGFTELLSEGEVAPPGVNRQASTAVKGELQIAILDRKGEAVSLAYRIVRAEVALAIDGVRVAAHEAAIADGLALWVFAEAAVDGRIREVRLAHEMGPVTANVVRAVLSSCQIVLPGRQAVSWHDDEDGPAGTATYHYELTGPGEVKKTRRDAVSGGMTATVDTRRGRLLTLSGAEAIITEAGGKRVGATETAVELSLLHEETTVMAGLMAMRERRRLAMPAATLVCTGADEMSIERTALGDETIDGLLATLDSNEEDGRTGLYLKLKALCVVHPESATRLGKRLMKACGPEAALLVQALAESGTPQAQKELLQVARTRQGEWSMMAELLPALGMLKSPIREVDATLATIAHTTPCAETRSTAMLALGSLARTLGASDRGVRIVDGALKSLETARRSEERRLMLLVLGNTGAEAALPAIRRYLKADDPSVRSAAVAALRWHADTDQDLCDALKGDQDDTVRQEAAHAFAVRTLSPVAIAAHVEALAGNGPATVRLAVLGNLDPHQADAVVRSAIEKAAKDSNEDVREKAAAMLAD